jgi:hypothetical protein
MKLNEKFKRQEELCEYSHVQAQSEVLYGVNRLSRFYIDTVNAFQK